MGFQMQFGRAGAPVRALACCLVATMLAGCSAQQARDTAKSLETGAPAALGDVGDVAQVESKLIRIDADSALHVAVSAHDGTVRLSGRVKSAEVGSRFENAAKSVPGVKAVDSALLIDTKLTPVSSQARDAGTVAAVTGDLVAQTGLNAFGVKVQAHAGVVTLSGHVKSAALKQTMLDAAKHAPGVKSVVDRLGVKA